MKWFVLLPIFLMAKGTVCVNYKGQLGNQMFQTAVAYAYAADNDLEFVIYSKIYNKNPDNFKKNYPDFFFKIPIKEDLKINRLYREKGPNYQKIPIVNQNANLILNGYFESYHYFDRYREQITELFSFSKNRASFLKEKYFDLFDSNKTVALHVRTYYRDWLKNKKRNSKLTEEAFYKKFIAPDLVFMKKALNLFSSEYTVYVFSDCISWCKKHLKGLHSNMVFMDQEHYINDLYLMSRCSNLIFANSTFAWWAAYLNSNPNKKIIVRVPWARFKNVNDDLIFKDWIRIEGEKNPPAIYF